MGIYEWMTQFSMGFRWITELFWAKSCSTTLWPFHWPGPSEIKGEHRGKSDIKSKTLIVNFPMCHSYAGVQTHAVNPHPSSDGGHDPMYQYQERIEGEYVWPFEVLADRYPFWEHKSSQARESMHTISCKYKNYSMNYVVYETCYMMLQVCNLFRNSLTLWENHFLPDC